MTKPIFDLPVPTPGQTTKQLLDGEVNRVLTNLWSAILAGGDETAIDALVADLEAIRDVAVAQTAADRAQTGLDVLAASAARTGAETARDSSFANAKGAATIADARALVADTETFVVYASGAQTFDAYRRLTSTTQAFLGSYPSLAFAQSRASGAFMRELFDAGSKFAQNIGRPSTATLVTASNMGDATYVWGPPVTQAARLTRFRMFALTSGVVTLRKFSLAGSDYTQVGSDISITVTAGANEIDLLAQDGLTVGADEYIGTYASGIGCSRVATGGVVADSGGWYFTAGNVSTFTRGSVRTDFQIQMGFDFEAPASEVSPAIATIEADATAADGPRNQVQTIGRAVDPDAGAGPASIGVYAMADAVAIPGSLRRVRLWSLAAASATIGIYARNDTIGQFARQRSFVVSLAIGLNEFSADDGDFDALPVSAGEFAAISVSGGVMAYSSSAADGAGWYTASAVDPATFTDAAVATNLRLEIGFDIVSRPVPITSKVPLGDGWNHVIADGQSNGVGATNGVVINTTPSDYHLTFDSGVKAAPVLTDGNNPATGTQALVEDTISPITGLSGSIYGDVGLWQFAAEFSRKRALAGVVPTLFCSSAAYSGAAAFKLAAGSPWWQVMIYHVRKAKEYADAAGVPYRVTAITFDHGESDQQTGTIAKADYRRLIENRIDCLWHDVAEITGQKDRPQWLFTTSPYHITTSDAPTEAINDLCRDRADCHLVTGGYRFEHRTDQLHLTATGQCVKRAMQARVLSRLVDGQPAPVIRWLGASGGGTSVVVRASSPAPLALNTTIVASVTASGFAVSDADGAKTVSGVALGASVWSDLYGAYLTDITLTINTSLGAAPIVRYAKTAIGASPVIASGAAGNVFDTTDDPVTVGGSPQSMANAAPPVTLKIHVPE